MQKHTTEELLTIVQNCQTANDLKNVLAELPDMTSLTVEKHLAQLLSEKGYSIDDIVSQTSLSLSCLQQIVQGITQPNRAQLLEIAFALHLTTDECNYLLTIAGLCILYSKSRQDSIIIFALEHQMSYHDTMKLVDEICNA